MLSSIRCYLWLGIAAGLVIFELPNIAAAREWRDLSGQFTKQAEFVALRGDRVVLKGDDGRRVAIIFAKLSADDRSYVNRLAQNGAANPFETEPRPSNEALPGPAQPSSSVPSNELPSMANPPPSLPPSMDETPRSGPGPITPPAASPRFSNPTVSPYMGPEPGSDFHPQRAEVVYGPSTRPPEQIVLDPSDNSPKSVYYGCRGTYCLVGGSGIARYDVKSPDCCGGTSKCLALLAYAGEDPAFYYYWPMHGDPVTKLWAFAKERHSCQFRVWTYSSSAGAWQKYDSTTRERPL